MPDVLQPYWNGHPHLSVDNGLVMKGPCLLIPASLHQRTLSDLHASHQGLTRTKSRARQIVFWPRMSRELEQVVRSCPECRLHGASQPKKNLSAPKTAHPACHFNTPAPIFFECQGLQFLVYVDQRPYWLALYFQARQNCLVRRPHQIASSLVPRRWRP